MCFCFLLGEVGEGGTNLNGGGEGEDSGVGELHDDGMDVVVEDVRCEFVRMLDDEIIRVSR